MGQTLTARLGRQFTLRRAARAGRDPYGAAQARAGWMFLIPALIHLVIFTMIPVVIALVLSFTAYRAIEAPRFVGFDNYINAFEEQLFWTALGNTIVYAAMSVPARMVIALGIAVLLNQAIPFRAFFRAAVYLPQVTSVAAISIVWMWLYNPEHGLINYGLKAFGVAPQNWLYDAKQALLAIVIMTTWYGVGSNMVIFLAGLQGIPEQLYEAGQIDGADRWQLFRFITTPMLSTTTIFVLLTNVMEAFRVFESIYVMTGGGPGRATTTLTLMVYKRGFENFQFGSASAIAFLLFIVVIAATVLSRLIVRTENTYD
jgi:multiple sugar transport system permease protein